MTDTLIELFEKRVNSSGTRPALRRKVEDRWETQSWKEWWECSERLAAGLISLGLEAGDRVAMICETRIEWVWLDQAVAMAAGVLVPLYPSSLPEQCGYMLEDCGARFVIVENPSQLDKILEAGELPQLTALICIDNDAVLDFPDFKGRRRLHLDDLSPGSRADQIWPLEAVFSKGRQSLADDFKVVAGRRRQIRVQDLASIVYTAGTCGKPRGVELTHGNFAAEVEALSRLRLFSTSDLQLLSLPLAHIFAKIVYLSGIGYGIETAFAESLPRLMSNLREVRPTFIASVPRVYEKIKLEVVAHARANPLRARAFDFALELGRKMSRIQQRGESVGPVLRLEHEAASRLILGQVQELFGGRMRFMISGGAPLNSEVAEFFHAAGILILEGYGLTETTAAATFNLPESFKFGTVGRPVPGVDITIAEDGEVLIRGATVMRGYHNEPAATGAAIDDEGWLHTGDVGHFNRDGQLVITDRKKNLIVTSTGKNVAPQHVEELLEQCALVNHAVVFGDNRPFISALLTLEPAALLEWAEREKLEERDYRVLTQHLKVREALQAEVDAVNQRLASFETIKKFAILDEDFALTRGELTATGSLRRQEIQEHYQGILESFYGDNY